MGWIRKLLSIGMGVAAGALACHLLEKNNQDGHLEGEYRILGEDEDNPNPVTLGGDEKPLRADGRLDPTRIARAEDFGDWDEYGCRG